MRIDAELESGNAELVAPTGTVLRIRKDPVMGFLQWFHFRVQNDAPDATEIVIENAAQALVPKGWENYAAFASTDDGVSWSRVPTRYDDGRLTIAHARPAGTTLYAYFPPYRKRRHDALIARCRADGRFGSERIAVSEAGDALDLLTIGSTAPDAACIWIIGRQHPGEVQASWWMDAFLSRLLDGGDPDARAVLARCRLRIVPNMNPDGSRLGLHRTNSYGVNLNLAWAEPESMAAPAVQAVRRRMDVTGVDFALDVHADEELPYTFIANVDRVLPVPPELQVVRELFETQLAAGDDGMRAQGGYFRPHTKSDPLAFCGPQIIRRYHAPALTIELPYKQAQPGAAPPREYGVEGCAANGRAALTALRASLDAILAVKKSRRG